MPDQLGPLHELAQLYGVYTSYYDVTGKLQEASAEALLPVLRQLGAATGKLADVPDALRQRQHALWQTRMQPVVVAWDGGSSSQANLELRLPAQFPAKTLRCSLRLESGEERRWDCDLESLPVTNEGSIESSRYLARSLPLPSGLPWGYHRLVVEFGAENQECLILAAPVQGYRSAESTRGGLWGVFLPLYALHSERSWGAGDFSDLQTLTRWVTEQGGGMVATLPLLAAFLDEPFEPGPYSPASRLFWNEFYLDVNQIPELPRCPAAQRLLGSPDFQAEIQELRQKELVDYPRQMGLKRRVLEELARTFFANPGERGAGFEHFLREHPLAEDYASFRAVGEQRRAPWPAWPAPLRDGVIGPGDYDEAAKRYHLYVQWLADEQLQKLAS